MIDAAIRRRSIENYDRKLTLAQIYTINILSEICIAIVAFLEICFIRLCMK